MKWRTMRHADPRTEEKTRGTYATHQGPRWWEARLTKQALMGATEQGKESGGEEKRRADASRVRQHITQPTDRTPSRRPTASDLAFSLCQHESTIAQTIKSPYPSSD